MAVKIRDIYHTKPLPSLFPLIRQYFTILYAIPSTDFDNSAHKMLIKYKRRINNTNIFMIICNHSADARACLKIIPNLRPTLQYILLNSTVVAPKVPYLPFQEIQYLFRNELFFNHFTASNAAHQRLRSGRPLSQYRWKKTDCVWFDALVQEALPLCWLCVVVQDGSEGFYICNICKQ